MHSNFVVVFIGDGNVHDNSDSLCCKMLVLIALPST